MARERICGIYCIENKINGKKYIGQSVNIHRRWNSHKSKLRKSIHNNQHLQSSWNKYGEHKFDFYIIEECLRQELNSKEIYWMDFFNVLDREYGFNLAQGGFGNPFGDVSEEELRKILYEKGFTKFTCDDVLEIIERLQDGDSTAQIAKDYNVSKATIDSIKGHRTWRFLTENITFVNHNPTVDNPIDMYSKDGQFIKSFPNFASAEDEMNINRKLISAVCHGRDMTTHGYVFRFSGHPFDQFIIGRPISVDQYNMHWEFIASYETVKEASAETNVFGNHIRDVINKKRKTAGNYYWLKAGEQPPENKESTKCEPLWKAVNQYDEDWNLIQSYMSISQASRKLGISTSGINNALHKRNKTAGGYYWLFVDETPREIVYKVDQYDYEWNFIKSYRTISEAARETNLTCSGISSVLNKRIKTSGGFNWLPHGEKPNYKRVRTKFTAIDQYDINWNYIKTYHSVKQASIETHADHRTISNVLAKRYHTAGGYRWLYHGETPPVVTT